MSSTIETVCKNCSDLDLRAIFAGKFEMEDGFVSRKSDPSLRWAWNRTENCQFCSFIGKCSVFRTIVYDPPELDAQLEPKWLKREESKWFKQNDVILRLVFDTALVEESWLDHSRSATSLPHSLIGCAELDEDRGVEGTSGPIRVVPPFVQCFDDLKWKIKTCQEGHSCMQHASSQEPPISIRNLLLIDCMSRQVVAAPHRCWYLALSYVWGNQKARTVKVDEKLTCLPQTIEDAITVTSKLGFRYLWVDMYCIRQDNQSHVGDQIRHMDLVYRQAQATIIAAAGDNPAFGLPGVSCARQTRQVHVTMNGLTVANFAHNPWELVDSSVWNSRAWTFQESLFSPCRIFFTTEQVIFNCSSGWNCETIRPAQSLNINDANRNRNWMVRQSPPVFHDSCSKDTIYLLISQYSHRRLTFSNDILNAFSGVLHAYGRLASPIQHLWGIPILPHESSILQSFSMGLSWGFSDTAAFSNKPSIPRRGSFPSWSWTGWEHSVYYRDGYATPLEYLPPLELNIAVEITHGSKASWMELRETTMNCQLHLSKTKYLRLEAWTTPVVLHYPEEELLTPFKRAYAVVGQEGNSYKFSAQIPVVQEPIELEPMVKYDDTYLCTGIVLGGFRDRNYPLVVEYPLLLVAKKGYFWERIGIAYLREVSKVFPLYIDPLHPYLNHLRERRLFEEWMRYHLPLHRQVIYLG